MGVTVVQTFSTKENRTGPQTIEFLTKRVVALGANPAGQFLVDCETYTSAPNMQAQSKTVHLLHDSERPASVFSVLDTGTKTVPLVADALFDLIMMKIIGVYAPKKQNKVESKGPRFEIGDFCVKLGSVTVSQNFKGVLVEVEYRPCVIPASCWDLMREFMQGFLGSTVPGTPPQYLQSKMNDVYQPIDTIQQYLEQFSIFRKAPGSVRP